MVDLKEDVTVILDTNFLVDLFKFNLNLEDIENRALSGVRLVVVSQTVKELEKINSKHAKLGLAMIKEGRIYVADWPGVTADDAIISFISKEKREGRSKKSILATNDSSLRKKAKEIGARVIYLRARKHLEISD